MAEIMLNIGDKTGYKDGDVLCAFNNDDISLIHAQHLINEDQFDGYMPTSCLRYWAKYYTHEFMFIRVGYTVIRTNLSTGAVDEFGPDMINVDRFLQKRLSSRTPHIFGSENNEIWFGGQVSRTTQNINDIWAKIAEKKNKLKTEEQYTLCPFGDQDLRSHLVVRTIDFSNQEREDLIRQMYMIDANGDFVLQEDGQPIPVESRVIKVQWVTLLDDLQVTENQVVDPNIMIGETLNNQLISKTQPSQNDRNKLINKWLS